MSSLFISAMSSNEQSEGYLSQLGLLTTSVSRHEATLESLKGVPEMLKAMASQMGLPLNASENDSTLDDSDQAEFGESSTGERHTEENDLIQNMLQNDQDLKEQDCEISSDLLEALQDCEKGQEVGPEIGNAVAEAYNRTVQRKLSKETHSDLLTKIKIPANCKPLTVPKMNGEIWNHLQTKAKIKDLGFQSIQQSIGYAITALAVSSNEIARHANQQGMKASVASSLLQINMNAANILGHSFQQITSRRRSEVKPFLNADFASICSTEVPATEFLFGSDLKEAVKNSKTASMVMKQTFAKRQYRSKPYETNHKNFRFTQQHGNLNRSRPSPSWQSQRRGGGLAFNRNQYSQSPKPSQFQPRRN